MRFYGFEKVAALERATCLEPDGIVLQLSAVLTDVLDSQALLEALCV